MLRQSQDNGKGYLTRCKRVHGFQIGDMVKAEVPSGKNAGIHIGRVAVRATGSFNIQTVGGAVQGISHKRCRLLQRADGYGYAWQVSNSNTGQGNFPVSSPSWCRSAL